MCFIAELYYGAAVFVVYFYDMSDAVFRVEHLLACVQLNLLCLFFIIAAAVVFAASVLVFFLCH